MTQILVRRGTAADWAAATTVVLGQGEIGFETDTGRFKIGDGIHHWADLTAFAPGASYSDEQARDAIAAMIAAGTDTGLRISYDDSNDKMSFTAQFRGVWVNGATPAYMINDVVVSGGKMYSSSTDNNTTAPTDTGTLWADLGLGGGSSGGGVFIGSTQPTDHVKYPVWIKVS